MSEEVEFYGGKLREKKRSFCNIFFPYNSFFIKIGPGLKVSG